MKSYLYAGLVAFAAPIILTGKALKGTGKGIQIAGRKVEAAGERTEAKGVGIALTSKMKAIEAKGVESEAAAAKAEAKEQRRLARLAHQKHPVDEAVDAFMRCRMTQGAIDV